MSDERNKENALLAARPVSEGEEPSVMGGAGSPIPPPPPIESDWQSNEQLAQHVESFADETLSGTSEEEAFDALMLRAAARRLRESSARPVSEDACSKCGLDACCATAIGSVGDGIPLSDIGVGEDATTLYTGEAVRQLLDRARPVEAGEAVPKCESCGTPWVRPNEHICPIAPRPVVSEASALLEHWDVEVGNYGFPRSVDIVPKSRDLFADRLFAFCTAALAAQEGK